MDQKQLGLRSRASSSAGTSTSLPAGMRHRSLSIRTSSTLAERYLGMLPLAPGVVELIGDGELVSVGEEGMDEEGPAVKSASDYSYSADTYAGPGWRVIGDAGGTCIMPRSDYGVLADVNGSVHRPVFLVGCAPRVYGGALGSGVDCGVLAGRL